MAKSTRNFSRWEKHDPTTWSLQIFHRYSSELTSIWDAHILSSRKVFSALGDSKANWEDLPSKHFVTRKVNWNKYKTLKDWSDAYNLFDNWVNLSAILTVASNLETYLASVISLSLESDPGVLVGATRSIDGALILKHKRSGALKFSDAVTACIKNDWSSRIDAFERIFGSCPPEYRAAHSDLEKLRSIRNRFGHAFGRDIETARLHGTLKVLPMEKIPRQSAQNLRETVIRVVKALDIFLLERHIGDFEAVRFYHNLYPALHKSPSRNS